jgi:feruloyl-CoA hydratase/lyase
MSLQDMPDSAAPATTMTTTQRTLRGIQTQCTAGVLTITLNRPQQRNAMDVALTLDMQTLLQEVAVDRTVRVVLLCGAGAGFSVGWDDVDFSDAALHSDEHLRAARAAASHWPVRLLRLLPQPVIARVHGFCLDEAIAVIEGCDIVFAADNTRFGLPAIDAAQLPAGPLGKSLSRVMAPRAASFHALTGQAFGGVEAARCGLVTRSFPAQDLEPETASLITDLLAKDALALQFTKETLQHVGGMDWDAVLNFNAAKLAQLNALKAGQPSARAAAVESFLAGKSKPGLGA